MTIILHFFFFDPISPEMAVLKEFWLLTPPLPPSLL